MPADVHARKTFDFTFYGGQGWLAEPRVRFALYVNDVRAVEIPETTLESRTWAQGAYTLRYERDPETMERGTYTLTVPSHVLKPGVPAVLRVVAEEKASRRWFGVCEM